jgi:hypothetical protein
MRLTLALDPAGYCTKTDYGYRNCHFDIAAASKKILVSEEGLKEGMESTCEDLKPEECHDRAEALLQATKARIEAIDTSKMLENLGRVDPCLAVYKSTIDKKISDLTTRESDQIKACKALDLYPPEK